MMGKKYLVTGGAGFIGSHIVEELVRQGEYVRTLDNYLTGRKENLEEFKDSVDILEGDIRDEEFCRYAVKGVDYVLHQAALPSVPRSVKDPVLTNQINVLGTLNMLVAARDAGVEKFVFASSSSVYGDDPRLPKSEEMGGIPLSPYAISKIAGEKYCQVFSRLYGFYTVALRYFNVFGPRQDPTSQYAAAVPIFITHALRGERPTVFGDGFQSRDFTFVRNVVDANLLALQSGNIAGEILNIACGDRITVNSLIESIGDSLRVGIEPRFDPPRPGDIEHSFADISKAKAALNYSPRFSFADGLLKTINWYKEMY